MTTSSPRRALVVRGGWDGHAPVAATELFIPFLEANGFAVRVEESPAIYEDAAELAATDLIVQSVTMSEISKPALAGLIAAVAAGTGMAGWHGGIADSFRSSSDYLHLIGGQFATHPGRAPELRSRRAGGQLPALPRRDHRPRPRASDHRRPRRLRPRDRAVLGAARRPDRRARDHDPPDAALASVAPTGDLARRLDPRVGPRAHRRRHPGAQRRGAAEPERAEPSWRGGCCGRAARHRNRRTRGHLRRLPRRRSRGIPSCASSRSPTSTRRGRVEVAATTGAVALGVDELVAHPEVRTVLNLTIPAAHADIALRAIEAGRDVFGEKPLAATFDDAVRVIDCGRRGRGGGRMRSRHRSRNGHPNRPRCRRRRRPRNPGVRDRDDDHPRARGAGTPTPTSTTATAGVRCSTWGRTTCRRSCRSSGRRSRSPDARVACATPARSRTAPRLGEEIPVEVETHVTGVIEHASGALSTITTSFDGVATTAAPIEIHGTEGSLAVPDPNNFDGDVRLRPRGATEWDVVPPAARLRRRLARHRSSRLRPHPSR